MKEKSVTELLWTSAGSEFHPSSLPLSKNISNLTLLQRCPGAATFSNLWLAHGFFFWLSQAQSCSYYQSQWAQHGSRSIYLHSPESVRFLRYISVSAVHGIISSWLISFSTTSVLLDTKHFSKASKMSASLLAVSALWIWEEVLEWAFTSLLARKLPETLMWHEWGNWLLQGLVCGQYIQS